MTLIAIIVQQALAKQSVEVLTSGYLPQEYPAVKTVRTLSPRLNLQTCPSVLLRQDSAGVGWSLQRFRVEMKQL